jgi:hypothetical protein
MGSAVHAALVAEGDEAVLGMICLEMIGYFSEHQPWPGWFWRTLYPKRGDFVLAAGRWRDRHLNRWLQGGFRGSDRIPLLSFIAPFSIPGLDASDHRSYWQQGLPAILVTDTAFLRNPNYHTPDDRPETLDYERMAAVVDGLFLTLTSPPPAALTAELSPTGPPSGGR